MKLYHATFKAYLESIQKEGLIPNPKNRNWGFSDDYEGVYLAIDEDQAISFAECAEETPLEIYESGIVVIEVELDRNEVDFDPNNLDNTTFIYNGTIKEFTNIKEV